MKVNRLKYIIILFFIGCNSFIEKDSPLDVEFYIKDGWLAFSSNLYQEAINHFNTAIETSESNSIYHFLAYIGKGWSFMYNAKTKNDSINVQKNLISSSGIYFNNALEILYDLDGELYNVNQLMDLYSGITLQLSYRAKQIAAHNINWETSNLELKTEIDSIYRKSIHYSSKIYESYFFNYDSSVTYETIILQRIENYIIIGEIDSAIFHYKDYGFDCNGYNIDYSSIVECLCITLNNGDCPFEN